MPDIFLKPLAPFATAVVNKLIKLVCCYDTFVDGMVGRVSVILKV